MFYRRLLVFFIFLVAMQIPIGHLDLLADTVSLVTADGVQLKITYYPGNARKGSPQAKQTTPVVLVHDYKSSRSVFAQLAQKLQAMSAKEQDQPSFAVVTVDLRAHGESVKQVFANGAQGDLDAAKVGKDDVFAMATADMDAVRNFLVDKNDAGDLNLNKLCLVGSGMGASVAANWALRDWSYPPLAVGKQGQDVKAIVLISPRWSYSGLAMQGPMQFRALKENVAWLLIYGDKDPKVQADVVRIKKQLDRFHPATKDTGAPRASGLAMQNLKTKLQGDSLLAQNGAAIEKEIMDFLFKNVATTQPPWIARRNRLP